MAGNWTTLRNVTEQTSTQTKPQEVGRTVPFRTGAVIVIAVAIGLILWLALRDTGSGGGKAVSAADLQKLASSVGHPVFWLGQVDGDTNELTKKSDGSIIVRYLPPGVGIGAKGQYLSLIHI